MEVAARPLDIAPWLFCTKTGKGYFDEKTGRPDGWNSIWQRFMTRLLEEIFSVGVELFFIFPGF